ncbi:uncharacterized protein LOC111377428 [Olea europaea var. sylvestris]|uniref:uncharacterized protein LOC111377428 n=1 Tax=Olea europaea var. sylvestris TaxID=158386 RepID=UPI000C1D60F2|nr:uncharacterized protein LOC111377428 [Olea europaea var. sylvestris]
MASYLERAGISTWSRAHFVGNRYNVMTNNIAESLNSVLRRQRSFPIISLIENITSLMQRWFYERKSASTKCSTTVTPKIDDEFRKSFNAGATLPVRNLDELVFEIDATNPMFTCIDDEFRKSFNAGATLPVRNLDELVFEIGIATELCTVDLIGNTYSFREFQMRQILCSHASRAAYAEEKSLYDLCFPYYTTKYWRAAYNEVLHPVGRESDWNVIMDTNKRGQVWSITTNKGNGAYTQYGNGYKSNP